MKKIHISFVDPDFSTNGGIGTYKVQYLLEESESQINTVMVQYVKNV